MIRYLSSIKLIKQSSQGKHINWLIICLFLKQLLRHIGWSPTKLHRSTIELSLHIKPVTLCLAKPKSQSLTLSSLSIRILWDLISLWTISWWCKNAITPINCRAIFVFYYTDNTYFLLCSKSKRVPYFINYMTRQSWGGDEIAPNMRIMFGWRYLANILT